MGVSKKLVPASLFASELPGHEKGAFSGALRQRRGRFDLAHPGPIFLGEIGEVPVETQLGLLNVLRERQFERVGGNCAIPADVRIIAPTNRELSLAIAAGTFRLDMFYWFNVLPIQVPPLRKLAEDIPLLIDLLRCLPKDGKRIKQIEKRTLELQGVLLAGQHWGTLEYRRAIHDFVYGDTFSIDKT